MGKITMLSRKKSITLQQQESIKRYLALLCASKQVINV